MQNSATNKQLRIGAVLSYISMIVGYVIQISYTPLMLRIVGQTQYGIYNLTNSIVSYLSLFSLGFESAYVRFYMKHKAEEDKIAIEKMNGMFMIVFLFLGILATSTGLLLTIKSNWILGSKFSNSELVLAKKLMGLMVFNIAISFPLIPVNAYIQSNEKFIFQNALNILRQILNPFLSLPLLLMGLGSLGLILATTIISMIIGIWQLVYSIKVIKIKFSFTNLNFSELKEVAIFSSFLFLNAVTDQINWNVDKFIIGRYYGATLVAIYGIAAQLNMYYLNFSTAISNVYIPKINRIVAEHKKDMNEKLTEIFIKIGRVQFMVVVFILIEIIFLGRPFIGIWAGKEYYSAYPILLILIIPVTIPLVQNAGIAIQQAKNMHVFRSVLYTLIAVGNVLLSLLWIKRYGAIGTASATAISLIIGNGILMNWYYQTHIGLDIKKFWKEISLFTPMVIVSSITGSLITRLVSPYTISGFFIVGVLISFVYGIMLIFTVLNESEIKALKMKLVSIIRK